MFSPLFWKCSHVLKLSHLSMHRKVVLRACCKFLAAELVGTCATCIILLNVNRTWHSWQDNSLYTSQFLFNIKPLHLQTATMMCVSMLCVIIPCPCYCIKHTICCIISCVKVPNECYTLKQVFMYSFHANSKENIPEWISGCYRSDRENYSFGHKFSVRAGSLLDREA
jgi:hypothetical protein